MPATVEPAPVTNLLARRNLVHGPDSSRVRPTSAPFPRDRVSPISVEERVRWKEEDGVAEVPSISTPTFLQHRRMLVRGQVQQKTNGDRGLSTGTGQQMSSQPSYLEYRRSLRERRHSERESRTQSQVVNDGSAKSKPKLVVYRKTLREQGLIDQTPSNGDLAHKQGASASPSSLPPQNSKRIRQRPLSAGVHRPQTTTGLVMTMRERVAELQEQKKKTAGAGDPRPAQADAQGGIPSAAAHSHLDSPPQSSQQRSSAAGGDKGDQPSPPKFLKARRRNSAPSLTTGGKGLIGVVEETETNSFMRPRSARPTANRDNDERTGTGSTATQRLRGSISRRYTERGLQAQGGKAPGALLGASSPGETLREQVRRYHADIERRRSAEMASMATTAATAEAACARRGQFSGK